MAIAAVRSKGGTRSRFLAASSYLGILCFIPLVMNKDDEFVYFHAKQGLVIWMWGVLALIALYLPGIGKWFFGFSTMAVLVLSLIGLTAVALNKAWKLPLVHSFAARF